MHDDERMIIAQETLEDTQAELSHTLTKELDKKDVHVEPIELEVNDAFNEISGKANLDGKVVDIVATLITTEGVWAVNVNGKTLTVPTENLDYELSELEEAKDNLVSLEEGDDEEELDHPDGEDEQYED